uniref:dUTP diphosphatase n=1 Tax=Geotrypetes seraphini TaxID=260995 RepID=A0A6P8S1K8_GEOSA|nr:uncharacterized protein LOC117365388 [Geotrypetes seraphini]
MLIETKRGSWDMKVAVVDFSPYPVVLGKDWAGLAQQVAQAGEAVREPLHKQKWVMGARVVRNQSQGYSWGRRESTRGPSTNWKPVIRWAPLSDKAHIPTRAYDGAAGYDLYAAQEQVVPAQNRALINTDIQVSSPPGSYLRIAPRSGLALRHAIDVAAGVVDPDYRGNLAVLLVNQSNTDYKICPGDRIAQMICERIWHPKLTKYKELPDTQRGGKGFGSSDKGQAGESQPPGKGKQTEQDQTLREEIKSLREELEKLKAGQNQASPQIITPETASNQASSTGAEVEKLQKDLAQMYGQVQQVRKQLQEEQTRGQDMLVRLKKTEELKDRLAGKDTEAQLLAKQNEAGLERWERHFGKMAESLDEASEDMDKLQQQVNALREKELGEVRQAVSALAQRMDVLEESGGETSPGVQAGYETPVLQWPDDFMDPDPLPTNQGKKFNKTRRRY